MFSAALDTFLTEQAVNAKKNLQYQEGIQS